MNKRWFLSAVAAVFLLLGTTAITFASGSKEKAATTTAHQYTFYWISHGRVGDPFWIYALSGAKKAAAALNINLKSSFHNGDLASQINAIDAAVAAGADGIATSAPQGGGALTQAVQLAHKHGIPVVFFNTDDPSTGRDAYVGANNVQVGKMKAEYLVQHHLVKSGDLVWCPVEVPGATYGVDQMKGVASVFKPLGIKYTVFDAGYEPAKTLANMTSYLTAHGNQISAMIGLGDLTTGDTEQAFKAAGWGPGHIPVVGWGNSLPTAKGIQDGYVNAAVWQYPASQGALPIVLLYMDKQGMSIGYDINTVALYTKANVGPYLKILEKMSSLKK